MRAPASTRLPSSFPPVEYVRRGAHRCGSGGVRAAAWYARVRLDPELGAAIAHAYMAAPDRDDRAVAAYARFRHETARQYRFLVGPVGRGGLGVAVRVVDEDPYADAGAMADDLRQRTLKVWATGACGNPHPYLNARENDMFRAVHDAFGHAAIGRGFDRDGEEAAWLMHSSMYSPLAQRALTTETRGQNCALTFHYRGERFPEQKAALLPLRFSDPRRYRVPR